MRRASAQFRTLCDAALLLAHLARLDKIAGSAGIHAAVRDFDREVERPLDPRALYDWDDEDEAERWEGAGREDKRWADEDDDEAALEDAEGDVRAESDTEAQAHEHGDHPRGRGGGGHGRYGAR